MSGHYRRIEETHGRADTTHDWSATVDPSHLLHIRDQVFYDDPSVQSLPDGRQRRGMSVVAALSEWPGHGAP